MCMLSLSKLIEAVTLSNYGIARDIDGGAAAILMIHAYFVSCK
jgi:hypothetical protein